MHPHKIFIGVVGVVATLVALSSVEAGELVGSVQVTVEERPTRPRRYYKGPFRSGRPTADAATGASDTVVWAIPEQPATTEPLARAVMRQKNETFLPGVLPVTVGTTVEFPNEDPFYHNVFSYWAGDRFDLGRYAAGDTAAETFHKPGVVVVRCEIHTGMKAHILVLETPYFTVVENDSTYVLPDLPAGRYTVKVWHPTAGEKSKTVEVPAVGKVVADFDL